MAKLPKRGCLVDPDTGQVIWAWEQTALGPDVDFTALPPSVTDMDGNTRLLAEPHHVVLDLEKETTPAEMKEIAHRLQEVRFRRQPDQSWSIKRIMTVEIDGAKEEVEVDHDVQVRREMKIKRQNARSTESKASSSK